MTGRAALKDRQLLKGPRLSHNLPSGVLTDELLGIAEIRLIIRAKVKPGALPCPLGCGGQELGLHDAIFVMAAFRPGVGKEDVDCRESGLGWERIEKITGIGLDKVEVIQLGAITLTQAAINPIFADINAHADFGGMSGGVSSEKMAMSAADF